jgi:hypothetical protein
MHFICILFLIKNNILVFYINSGYRCFLFVKHQGVIFVRAPMHMVKIGALNVHDQLRCISAHIRIRHISVKTFACLPPLTTSTINI